MRCDACHAEADGVYAATSRDKRTLCMECGQYKVCAICVRVVARCDGETEQLDGRPRFVCWRCSHEHPRSGRYAYNGDDALPLPPSTSRKGNAQ